MTPLASSLRLQIVLVFVSAVVASYVDASYSRLPAFVGRTNDDEFIEEKRCSGPTCQWMPGEMFKRRGINDGRTTSRIMDQIRRMQMESAMKAQGMQRRAHGLLDNLLRPPPHFSLRFAEDLLDAIRSSSRRRRSAEEAETEADVNDVVVGPTDLNSRAVAGLEMTPPIVAELLHRRRIHGQQERVQQHMQQRFQPQIPGEM